MKCGRFFGPPCRSTLLPLSKQLVVVCEKPIYDKVDSDCSENISRPTFCGKSSSPDKRALTVSCMYFCVLQLRVRTAMKEIKRLIIFFLDIFSLHLFNYELSAIRFAL